jgi:hypothetical protein
MIYYILKVVISSVIIVIISEISKRSSLAGSILASLPLMSVLAFIWLYIDTKDVAKVIELSNGIFWLVLPSLIFFLAFPALLKKNLGFGISMSISTLLMITGYFIMLYILRKFGIKI